MVPRNIAGHVMARIESTLYMCIMRTARKQSAEGSASATVQPFMSWHSGGAGVVPSQSTEPVLNRA